MNRSGRSLVYSTITTTQENDMKTTNHPHPITAQASWSNDRQGPAYVRGMPTAVWRSALRRHKPIVDPNPII
jgi:hypothetical protein